MKLPDFPDDTDIRVAHGNPFVFRGPQSVELNPEFFAAKMSKSRDLLYLSEDGWFERKNGIWFPILQETVEERIRTVLKDEMRRADVTAYDKLGKAVSWTMKSLKSKTLKGKTIPALNPDIVPVRNGVLEWSESENKIVFRSYRPDDMVFNTLNVSYDPNAKSELFDRVIQEILYRPDNYRVVQEYLGGSLFSENRSRRFLTLQGASGSGKSTLSNMLTSILGPSRMICPSSDKINDKFAFSSMKSQSLILIPEAAAKTFETPDGCAFLKRACGHDLMSFSKKHLNKTSEHSGFFTIVIMTNSELRFYSDGEGIEIMDRLTPIVFDRKIENRDLQMDKKLEGENERSAFLNWLIEGAERLIRNNWEIELSEEQIKIRNRMVKATKGVELFVQEHVKPSFGDHFLTSDAYTAYSELVEKEGLEPLTEEKFARDLSTTMQKKFGVKTDHNLPAKKTPTMMGGVTQKKQTARGYNGFRLVH